MRRVARDNGLIYRNERTREEIRIMEQPVFEGRAGKYPQKLYFQYYYRYRSADDLKWGTPIPVPDKQ